MTSTPKRAAIACTYCRQRKRRCNGESPQCRTCRIKGLECSYVEPVIRRSDEHEARESSENNSNEQAKRLDALERLLREQTETIEALKQAPPHPSPFTEASSNAQNDIWSSSRVDRSLRPNESPLPFSIWSFNHTRSRPGPSGRDEDDAGPPITIPLGHQTSTSNVLVLPQCRALLGEYPEEFFFRVESCRPRAAAARSMMASNWDNLRSEQHIDRRLGDQYLQSFLNRVHPFHPFIDKEEIAAVYENTMERGIDFDDPSALVLAIIALGATVSDPIDRKAEERSGEAYIQMALKILFASWTFTFSGDVVISQALVLCAMYFTYTVEPLMAWRLIHMASTTIQQLLSRCKDILSSEPEVQTLTRLSFVCFIIESDILAEFHQPRSGIELMVDRMPFPNYGENPSPENHYALAEISARSLLNRIHHHLFFTDSLTIYTGHSLEAASSSRLPILNPDASHLRVCEELSRQLEAWYEALPEAIKPDLNGNPKGCRQSGILRLRYWSGKMNIHRAFVIYVTSRSWEGEVPVPPVVLEMCDMCLNACRMFILTTRLVLSERTPYTYSTAQFSLTCTLILSMAAQSPPLKHLVEDIETIQQVTLDILEPWAQPRTSIKSAYEIASVVASKQRFKT